MQKELEAALDQVMILEVRVKNQGVLENDIAEYERTRQ